VSIPFQGGGDWISERRRARQEADRVRNLADVFALIPSAEAARNLIRAAEAYLTASGEGHPR
jgi:hypothetical protein